MEPVVEVFAEKSFLDRLLQVPVGGRKNPHIRVDRVFTANAFKTFFLQDGDGQMKETHSVAAGLDYIGVSPILSHLHATGKARFEAVTDAEVVDALALTVRKEGLIPALESSHAFAQAFKELPDMSPDDVIIINQSGRADKDIFTVADAFDDPSWREFIIDKAEQYRA